jgi:hypothetical protein
MKTPATIKVPISWFSCDYSETPFAVGINITKNLVARIKDAQNAIKEHKFNSVSISVDTVFKNDEDGSRSKWLPDVENLKITSYGIYYYAQNKYDSADQIESNSLTEIKIFNKLLNEKSKKEKDSEKTIYILFGEEACNILDNDGINELINIVDSITFDIAKFKENDNVLDVLNSFNGWNGYTTINKAIYNKLAKHLNKK